MLQPSWLATVPVVRDFGGESDPSHWRDGGLWAAINHLLLPFLSLSILLYFDEIIMWMMVFLCDFMIFPTLFLSLASFKCVYSGGVIWIAKWLTLVRFYTSLTRRSPIVSNPALHLPTLCVRTRCLSPLSSRLFVSLLLEWWFFSSVSLCVASVNSQIRITLALMWYPCSSYQGWWEAPSSVICELNEVVIARNTKGSSQSSLFVLFTFNF